MAAPRKKPKFTLGIEEEFQIVDPVSRELKSHIEEIIEGGKVILKERVRPELHQSVVEVGTDICEDSPPRANPSLACAATSPVWP